MDLKKLEQKISDRKKLEQGDWTSKTSSKVGSLEQLARKADNVSRGLYQKVDQYIDYCHELSAKEAEKVASDVEKTVNKIIELINSL